jgi:hypothetical protein
MVSHDVATTTTTPSPSIRIKYMYPTQITTQNVGSLPEYRTTSGAGCRLPGFSDLTSSPTRK